MRKGLVKKIVDVTRAGKTFKQTRWVKPKEHKAAETAKKTAKYKHESRLRKRSDVPIVQKKPKLEESPWKYFEKPEGTKLVSTSMLDVTRNRPRGIHNASKLMQTAAAGKSAKREPITVFKKPDGRYEVVDGNSTTNVAKQHNWKELPVREVSAEEASKIRAGDKEKAAGEAEGADRIARREKVMTKFRRNAPGKGIESKPTKQEALDILEVGRFALVSAGKNPKLEKDMTPEAAAERHEQLRARLVEEGFQFTQVLGQYENAEDSFLVWVHDADRETANKLGEEFNQDSVIYGENGVYEMHYTTGDRKGTVEEVTEKPADATGWEDYYTEIPLADGSTYRFNINFQSWDEEDREKYARAKPYKEGSRKEFLYGVDDDKGKEQEVLSKLQQARARKK